MHYQERHETEEGTKAITNKGGSIAGSSITPTMPHFQLASGVLTHNLPANCCKLPMGAKLSVHCTIYIAASTDEIAFSIADQCDTLSVMRLLTVCDVTQRIIRRYMASVYDVNTLYEPFFGSRLSCTDFRRVQADTGALVSGFQAVQLFSRSRYHDSTLDLYVDCFQSKYMVRCLLQHGYRYVPSAAVHALVTTLWREHK